MNVKLTVDDVPFSLVQRCVNVLHNAVDSVIARRASVAFPLE